MGKRAGTYNVLNVWRLEEGCWEYCRWPSDRLAGRRAGCQWRAEGGGEWWPRNRRPDEVDKRFTNDAHPDPNSTAQRAWFMGKADKELMLSVSVETAVFLLRPSDGSVVRVCSYASRHCKGRPRYR
jgi:hypothetical protein